MPTFRGPVSGPVQPASAGTPGSCLPSAVRYARQLLWLQGAIWALLAIGFALPTVVALVHVLAGHLTWAGSAREVGWLPAMVALTGGFAVTKIRLACRLSGGRERIRRAVICVEIAMTCLGALITVGIDPAGGLPAGFFALAAVAGGGLSLAAAVGLMRREARRYFADPGPATKTAGDGDGDAGCSAVRAPIVIHLGWGAGAAPCQA